MSNSDAILVPRTVKKPPFTVEVAGVEPKKGETLPRRHPLAKDGLVTTLDESIDTIFDILKYSANKYGNAKALGTRKLIKVHTENKKVKKMVDGKEEMVEKKWNFSELGPYEYISFNEFQDLALNLGSGLKKLGLAQYDKVHLYGGTSSNWLAMAHGVASQSLTMVTAYDTLGESGLKHSIVQTGSKAIFLDPGLISTFTNVLPAAKEIKYVIYNSVGEAKKEHLEKLKSNEGIKVISFDDLVQLGKDNPAEPVPPKKEDLACVMYTSGSTGDPKGVKIKHKAVIAACSGAHTIVGEYIGPSDRLLTYLPQAHILEFVFENVTLFWGGTMGFGNPRTLSDTSVRNCKGDIREFQPTILVGVPAVWESVKKGIVNKVNGSGMLVKNMFWGALRAKEFLLSSGLPGSGILDAVVFSKIKDATGGRLRITLNGGGPIATDTQKFISMAIAPMIGGYGLTETAAMGAINDPMAWNPEVLGEIPASIEMKLVDFPDAGYYSTNKPPQGEIWIRGPSVTEGYYDNEKETKEAITEDGWFMTGDIGEFTANGHVRIIDRKKNLVKTQNGEYIALEKLESVYRSTPIVGNICVHADQNKSKPIAIIVPVEAALQKLAKENGVEGSGIEDLVHSEKLQGIVLKQLQAAGRAGGLAGIEIVDGVVMADEEWNAQNGMTTAAQKIQRKKILEKYKKEVAKAYGDSN